MSALLQEDTIPSKRGEALKRLNRYVEDLGQRKKPMGSLEGFEREVHQLMAEVEQEVVAEGLVTVHRGSRKVILYKTNT